MSDRVAVITGAARGIGRAYAQRLAADGMQLALADELSCEETVGRLPGDGHTSHVVDVSSFAAVEELQREVEEAHGNVDVLVNHAGFAPVLPFEELTFEQYRAVQAVNADGMILMSLAFVPQMRQRGWGRIVNTGSTVTLGAAKDYLPYIASKATVHGLTRALANELGEFGITVNAIAPGIVPTDGIFGRGGGGIEGMTNEEEVTMIQSLQTIKRSATVEDMAGALSFLVSEDASFVTGQILHVDGGTTRTGA